MGQGWLKGAIGLEALSNESLPMYTDKKRKTTFDRHLST